MDKELLQLETTLRGQIEAQRQLLALVKEKLAALRTARHIQVATLTQRENESVQALGELEKRRLRLTATVTQLLEPTATQPMRLGELAQRLPEPVRGRLLVLGGQLKEATQAVQRESALARGVSEALVKHMHGLVRTIGSAMTGVAVYGRDGHMPRAATAVSTFSATA